MSILYKGETAKAIDNFKITGVPVANQLFLTLLYVKHASAIANKKLKRLDEKKADAIIESIKEVTSGKYKYSEIFVVDQIQGGAGTSINMNVNEVIATLATDKLKDKVQVHPNDDVNMAQSTNDTIPTAIKLMLLYHMDKLILSMEKLSKELKKKSIKYDNIVKVARTHLQDAVPMTVGQTFDAYHSFIQRNITRLEENKKYLLTTNIGGTAIGTGINSSKDFIKQVNVELSELTGYKFAPADNLIDNTQNSDDFLHIASIVKTIAGGLSKICNDLRMLSSGPRAGLGELILPELQKGSSIMPGKVNPVILEMMNQICYQVFGNAETAFHACINSQFELNVMLPIYAKNMNEAFVILSNGIDSLREKVIKGIEVDIEKVQSLFDNSLCPATALNRHIGYDKTAELVKQAIKNKSSLIDEIINEKLLTKTELQKILDPQKLTVPQ
jgi:aspartate ammonia-lyase